MRLGHIEPDLVVDIKHIPAMSTITHSSKGTRIGAAVSGAQLGEHKTLAKAWPGVVEATNLIGSDQIQSRCTMVGNLCNASPAADSVPAMIAAKAKAVVVSPKGRRTVPVEKIVTGPGETSLARGELIEAIVLPPRGARAGDAYLRFIPRTEMDIAVVGAGVSHPGAGAGQDCPGGAWCSRPDSDYRAGGREGHHRHPVGRRCPGQAGCGLFGSL
jgi:carbon-monoxide dehydrogenase medium subunit